NRLDDVDAGKTAADAGQLRPDALAAVAELMALQTERLVRVEEELSAALRVADSRQRCLRQAFQLRGRALAAETQVKLDARPGRPDLNQEAVFSLGQSGGEPVGIDLEVVRLASAVDGLAVQPDLKAAGR